LTQSIHVGVVLDAKRVAWGTCPAAAAGRTSETSAALPLKESLGAIRDIVAPALEGKSLAPFAEMASQLAELEAPVTITRVLPEVEATGQVSRRELITGQLGKQVTGARVETIRVNRPLSPAIRFGISEALLKALAMAQGVTVAELLTEEYGLSRPRTIVPLHAEVKGGQAIPLYPQLASLELRLPGVDPVRELGEKNERLQRLVRQLSERVIAAAGGDRPLLHLSVGGGLGRLYHYDVGKILGALYGLERAAAPVALRVEDPLLDDDLRAQCKMLAELCNLLRMRGMTLQLVAGAAIEGLGDVSTILNADAAHMIRLSMLRLGTIHDTMTAAIACREKRVGVLLSGAPAETLGNVALAIKPELVAAPDNDAGIDELYGAMARTAAWLLSRRRMVSEA
jgi:methylaspartate ammonia-lyase